MANTKGTPMPTDGISKEEQKQLIKEAIQEWLTAQFAAFGWWSAKGIATIAFGVLIYFWLRTPLAGLFAVAATNK
jgi:hypothetical protein